MVVRKKKRNWPDNPKYRKTAVKLIPVILLPFLLIQYAFPQKLASTQDGEIVILFNDGSWKYAPTNEIENSRNHGCSYVTHPVRSDSQGIMILKKETFISHSYEQMKNTSRYPDYVHCDLAMGKIEGNKIIYLDYTLQTKYGLYNHGIIQEGKKLLIKLKDNETVELILDKTDKGIIDLVNNLTRYHTYAYLTPASEKKLKNSEVDIILMPWSMGNEIYSVTYPRIFMDQLFCLD